MAAGPTPQLLGEQLPGGRLPAPIDGGTAASARSRPADGWLPDRGCQPGRARSRPAGS